MSEWPAAELTSREKCPVCDSSERAALHHDLVDDVFRCAPGRWSLWRCAACGSAYVDPCPSPVSIHKAYQNYYTHQESLPKIEYRALSRWRKVRRRLVNGYINGRFSTEQTPACLLGGPVLQAIWPMRARLDREYRHLPRRPVSDGRLLDIGCGNGQFLGAARDCGWRVTGLDFDPVAVATCRQQRLDVREGGIEQFRDEAEVFEVITLCHVIEHVHEPMALLKACYRLLKPGGRLWLETPNIDSLGHERFGRHWRGLEPPRHLVLFNPRSMATVLSQAGFVHIEHKASTGPLLGMTKASSRLRRGLAFDGDFQLGTKEKARLLATKLLLSLSPGRNEFLTMIARRE
jgi:2-polyprenyl-3-methyl-5-hydroxy-6-metoxy-1,4-benzoquinol methylase